MPGRGCRRCHSLQMLLDWGGLLGRGLRKSAAEHERWRLYRAPLASEAQDVLGLICHVQRRKALVCDGY